ncbi:MAG: 1,4-alpha-glucan branching protein GlgB [Alphaproteobacteria bacterium]|nr:1,4-alpha-glucan branching protein GlgB [Alphaproteobacteria bacterium]MBO4644750.1 1,4-alpha-glucan branching protein GlgB [Alphaproteobacteria bacterium]
MKNYLDDSIVEALVTSGYGDPFSILGLHREGADGDLVLRTFQPQAQNVYVLEYETGKIMAQMERVHSSGLFQFEFPADWEFFKYRLRIDLWIGESYDTEDPYRFPPVLGEMDLYFLSEGSHLDEYDRLGAHPMTHDGVEGVSFALWAPNARRVSVVGPFNEWDGRRHMMRPRGSTGVWEIFIPHISAGVLYKYELIGPDGNILPLKADPFAFYAEKRPSTASVVYDLEKYEWQSKGWEKKRENINAMDAPISIYEVHLGSWKRHYDDNSYLSYQEMANDLVNYVKDMGYTHVELLPVNEHPFDGSWGYQATGLYAPTSRFGKPDDFRALVDAFHKAGIAVIMDWVPGHFPKDSFGLADFDGTALYEHADPRRGEHKDWGTKIYNYGRREVNNFLTSNAMFWNKKYQIDGLRVDAVASMLYLDYSRKAGEWIPNEFGGHEDLEAVAFLKRTNELMYANCPGTATFAEESTAWPMVSRPTYMGGLGFGYKWNMGWMHDTLDYMAKDPIYRRYHHNKMTFGMLYAYNENFVLPLSHDEVVHGKCSLLNKMSGDRWQKFANLRAYYGFMYAFPGKKLLFMGSEFAQDREWDYNGSLSWHLLNDPMHRGVQNAVRDLNHIYRETAALYEQDYDPAGFEWIDPDNADESVFTFVRYAKDRESVVVAVSNFTPVPRENYRIGVPKAGRYVEVFNSDAEIYGGSGMGNMGGVDTQEEECNGRPYSVSVTLPPLSTTLFVLQR